VGNASMTVAVTLPYVMERQQDWNPLFFDEDEGCAVIVRGSALDVHFMGITKNRDYCRRSAIFVTDDGTIDWDKFCQIDKTFVLFPIQGGMRPLTSTKKICVYASIHMSAAQLQCLPSVFYLQGSMLAETKGRLAQESTIRVLQVEPGECTKEQIIQAQRAQAQKDAKKNALAQVQLTPASDPVSAPAPVATTPAATPLVADSPLVKKFSDGMKLDQPKPYLLDIAGSKNHSSILVVFTDSYGKKMTSKFAISYTRVSGGACQQISQWTELECSGSYLLKPAIGYNSFGADLRIWFPGFKAVRFEVGKMPTDRVLTFEQEVSK